MVDCCELLKRYDTNRDGVIDKYEFLRAYDDWVTGKITKEEFLIVYDAWLKGSVNAVCPGCYPEVPLQVVKEELKISPTKSVYVVGEEVDVYYMVEFNRPADFRIYITVNGRTIASRDFTNTAAGSLTTTLTLQGEGMLNICGDYEVVG